ncbi:MULTISPECIES: hypothetical protein [Sphingobacterium]|uniref:hypothetical protein n=1 Tax=Sphingobacterium TaxID=28453 RepID=UPI00309E6AD3
MGTLLLSGTFLYLLSWTGQNNLAKYPYADSVVTVQVEQKQENKPVMILEAFQILDSDGGSAEAVLSMDKDGKCYVGKEFIGTITAAGELKSDTGELLVHLKGNELLSSDGKVSLVIKEDGTISNGSGKDITWGPDGILKNMELSLKIVPVDSKAKRAASLLVYSFFGSTETEVQK